MSEKKKKSLLLTNVYDFYVLEDKTSQKKFPSVCLSDRMYVRTWTFHVDTITFENFKNFFFFKTKKIFFF